VRGGGASCVCRVRNGVEGTLLLLFECIFRALGSSHQDFIIPVESWG